MYSDIIPFLTTFVFMFFSLSAFSMCCGYFHKFNVNLEGKSYYNTEIFYSKRYCRIWPFFALLVGLDLIMNPTLTELYQSFADLTLAFNLLPNPEIKVIGVGWFLGVVFLFYMIFPWFVYLLQNKTRAWFAFAIALIMHFLVVDYFLTERFVLPSEISNFRHNIVWSFPFFMIGGILYLYRENLGNPKKKYLWLTLAITSTISQFIFYPSIFGDNYMYLLIVFSFWILYAMTGGIQIYSFKLLENRFTKFIGGISMEIYLCHMVTFRAIEKAHLDDKITNPHLYYWITCIAGIGLAILFSYFVKYKLFSYLGNKIKVLSFLK
ncbi:acyltransferase family protein [Segatella baroniae]|uniref:acyltransferase family protein n=1 Tax=Segatella baroniae TaxID=305719 RepID=UPI0039B11737